MSKDKLQTIIQVAFFAWAGFVGKVMWEYNTKITAMETELKVMKEWRQAREVRTQSGRTR